MLAQLHELVAPTSNDLVRVALVANIKHQRIMIAEVEEVVKRDRQLHSTQTRAKVAARGTADDFNDVGTNLFGKHVEVVHREPLQILRLVDGL